MGGVTYYFLKGDNIARRKGNPRKVSNSEKVVNQRKKFAMLSVLATALQPAIKLGFPQRKKRWSEANTFFSCNKAICRVDGEAVTVNYEQLLCAKGSLIIPDVTVSYQNENKKLMFEQTAPEEEVDCNANDLVYAVLLEKEQGFCRLVSLRTRGENGSTSVTLPQKWNADNLIVYAFALSVDKKKASKSIFLNIDEGA